MDEKDIIDLTTVDDQAIIILDSEDENEGPSTKRTRRTPAKSEAGYKSKAVAGRAEVQSDTEVVVSSKRKRKPRRKRRTVVGDEDGEIIEVDATEGSEQVSREDSRERMATGESSKPASERSAKAAVDKTVRSLLDRITDAEDLRPPDKADDVKPPTSEDRKKRKKRRKREERDEYPEQVKEQTKEDLFFVDDAPAEVPAAAKFAVIVNPNSPVVNAAKLAPHEDKPVLSLPAHVSVFEGSGDAPIEIIAPVPIDSEDEDYIQYLDYDGDRRGPGVVRYFEDPEAGSSKTTRLLCKHCGEEGDHTAKDCTVVICLTCGARNEHSTRGCPISKTCFRCGMKGHVNKDCPNRRGTRGQTDMYDDCDRCGSTVHQTSECPTLWRMYDYVDDTERLKILNDREQLRDLDLGDGGEGYIGPDDWCYNCGGCGHLGDDCDKSHPHDFPHESSAFSRYNIDAGPFADAKQPEQRKPSRAAAYAAQMDRVLRDGFEYVIPLDVGKQAKKKEKARMEKRAQAIQEDDGEDWFANRGGGREPKGGRNGGGTPKGPRNSRPNTKITFGNLSKDDDRYGGRDRKDSRRDSGRRGERDERPRYDDLPGPSRETDSIQIRGAARKHERDDWDGSIRGAASRRRDDYDAGSRDNRRDRTRGDDRYGERDRDRRRERDRRGASPRREPKYRGGYSRY